MHLTRQAMDDWAEEAAIGPHILVLAPGDSLEAAWAGMPVDVPLIEGPAVAEVVVYRDHTWSARPLRTIAPTDISEA